MEKELTNMIASVNLPAFLQQSGNFLSPFMQLRAGQRLRYCTFGIEECVKYVIG
jgi:hypothetical protein